MVNDIKGVPHASLAQQRKLLIAQGAKYRTGISESAKVLRANLHADVLARNAINHLVANASSAFHNLFTSRRLTSDNFRRFLPFLLSGASLIVKRKAILKPVLVGAVALAAVGTAVYFLTRKKRRL
jgi:hypothetical protein